MRAAICEANRVRVQNQKAERLFAKQLKENYKLSHLDDIRRQLEEQQREKVDRPAVTPRSASIEPTPNKIQCFGGFDHPVRCVEATHGGSTLWSGETDGSIGIRSGVTGELSYCIGAVEGVRVDVIFATDNHMFVGFSDGSVRAFDPLVFVKVFESHEHEQSVSGFALSFEQSVISVSRCGRVAKLEPLEATFAVGAVACIEEPLICVATYGYRVFVGTELGSLISFDLDTLSAIQTYTGHAASVSKTLVQDGYLFSASADTTCRVWNIASGECLKVLEGHDSPVTALIADQVGQQVISVDLSGLANAWSTCEEKDFTHLFACRDENDEEVFSMTGRPAINAVKTWSVGSNGLNKVWHASINLIEDSIRSALRSMKCVIDQDDIELIKWNGLTHTLKLVALQLDASLASALNSANQRSVARIFYWKWMLRVVVRRQQGLRAKIVSLLERRVNLKTLRDFFSRWENTNRQKSKDLTNKAIANLLHNESERERCRTAGRQVLCAAERISRQRFCEEILVPTVEARRNVDRMRQVFASFASFCANRKRRHLLVAFSISMCNGMEKRTALDHFTKWLRFVRHRSVVHTLQKFSVASAHKSDFTTGNVYFTKWQRCASASRTNGVSLRGISIVGSESNRLRAHEVFTKWAAKARLRLTSKLNDELEMASGKRGLLEVSLGEINHLFQRRNLLHEVDGLLNQKSKGLSEKETLVQSLHEQIAELEVQLLQKQQNARNKRELSLQEQVADLISVLKCRTINFANDVTLMGKTVEKCKKVGATRVFLEAHQAVKRVIVELTKQPYLPVDEEWPLTETRIGKMKAFHADAILTAIKTMVITYDGMSAEQRMSLTSDQEIVVNARILNLLADHCLFLKNKRFSRR